MPPKKRKAPEVPHTGVMVAPQNVIDELLPYLAMGFAVERTKDTGYYCGLFSLAESLKSVRNLTETIGDIDHLSPKDLRDIVKSDEFVKLVDSRVNEFYGVYGNEEIKIQEREELLRPNFFSSQQLDMILSVVNERLKTSYRLGVITASGVGDRQRKVNGKPIPLPLKISRKKSDETPKQEYEMETYAIEASTQIFGEHETGPVVFIHNENAAQQLVAFIDHWQSFGLNPSPDGIAEVRSWGLDAMVNSAVQDGLYIVEAEIEEDRENGSIGAVRGQFLHRQPFPKAELDGRSVLQTSADHIYARNCSTTLPSPPPNALFLKPLREGQVSQGDLRQISKVEAVVAIPEPGGLVTDLKMYVACHPSPGGSRGGSLDDDEAQYEFKWNETPYIAGSIVLHLEEDVETAAQNVRLQDGEETILSCFVLEPIKNPFLISKIVRPLTKKAAIAKYPQKIADLREIASARGIETKGVRKANMVDLLLSDDMEKETKPLILYRTGICDDLDNWPCGTLVHVKGDADANGQVTIITIRGRQARWPLRNLAEEHEVWGILLPIDHEEESNVDFPATTGQMAVSEKGLEFVEIAKENEVELVTPPSSKNVQYQVPTPPSSKRRGNSRKHILDQHRLDVTNDVAREAEKSSKFRGNSAAADRYREERDRIKARAQKAVQARGESHTGSEGSESYRTSQSPEGFADSRGPEYIELKETRSSSKRIKIKPAQPLEQKVTGAAKPNQKKPAAAAKPAQKISTEVARPAREKVAGATRPSQEKPAEADKQRLGKVAKRGVEEGPEEENKAPKRAKRALKKTE